MTGLLNRADLRPYQERAAKFIVDHENCALWLQPGLGKTISTYTAYVDLLHTFDARRMLVVGPLRVARKVWTDETSEWDYLSGLKVATITGSPAQRMKALRTAADVHTINYENLAWLECQFITSGKQITRWPWDLVVLDESQKVKSRSSERWKVLRRLRNLFPRLVELSGTPSPNSYEDLWSQMYLLDGGARLGRTEKAFKERWFDPPKHYEFGAWTLKPHADKEIQSVVSDIVLSMHTDEYMSLPPVVYNFIKVQLPPAAMRTYREMAREYISEVKGKTLTAVNAGVLDGKLLQLANGVVYTGEGREYVEFHEEKMEALRELVEAVQGRLLIAYYYRHDLARIKALLEESGRSWSILRSDQEFEDWANGKYEIGVLHPASAGHGLNDVYRSGCEDIVHYGLSASLELYIQVNDRLAGGHRRQGRNVKVHHIVAEGTRDMDYIQILKSKASTQSDLTRSLVKLV